MTTSNKATKTDNTAHESAQFLAINANISTLEAAEKITKEVLGELSRSILEYYLNSEDVRPVNRLLGKRVDGKFLLTPINWRIACQYFHHFLPAKSNFNDVREFIVKGTGARNVLTFGTKNKKTFDNKALTIYAWLEVEANDIWSFSNDIEMEAKPVDYMSRIQKAIEAGIEKGDLENSDILIAVLSAGVSSDDIIKALNDIVELQEPSF